METLKSRIGIYLVMVFVISFSTGYAEFAAFTCRDHIENIQLLTFPNSTGNTDVHVRIKNVSSAPQGTAGKWFKVRYEGANHVSQSYDLLLMLKTCSNLHLYYHAGSSSELVINPNTSLKFYFNR